MFTEDQLIAELSATQIVALTLWGEARGQSPELRHAIGCVIQSRAEHDDLTPREICLQHQQFSCWNPDGSFNHMAVMGEARLLLRGGGDHVGPIMTECLALSERVVEDQLVDTVKGARWYYSPAAMVPAGRVPKWAVGIVPVARIDNTLFFDRVAHV